MPETINIGTVEFNNITYDVSFCLGKEISALNGIKLPDINLIQENIQQHDLDPATIKRITARGIELHQGEISDATIHEQFTSIFPILEPKTEDSLPPNLPQGFSHIESDEPMFSSSDHPIATTIDAISKTALIHKQFIEQRGDTTLSSKATQTSHYGLELSSLSTRDFQYRNSKPILAQFGDITIRQRLLKNSALNGRYFLNDQGELEQIHDAITSSFDRVGQKLALGRRIETGSGAIIAYAGRPDTQEKAIELIKMAFLSEWRKEDRRGISPFAGRDNTYNFTFLVNSLLSTNLPLAEKRLTQEIYSVLKKMEKHPLIIKIEDQQITIVPRPLFIAEQFNWANRTEDFLSDDTSGKEYAKNISKRGMRQLLAIASQYIHNSLDNAKKTRIEHAVYNLEHNFDTLQPEEILFYRFYLCNLLEIPIITHCKSSVDRTGIAIALASSIKQWQKAEENLPSDLKINDANPHLMMDKEEFKELFAHNLLGGCQITKIARGQYGYKFNHGILQNPAVLRLLPDGYLTDYKISNITTYMKNNNVGKHLSRLIAFFITGIALTTIFSNRSISHELTEWVNKSSGIQKRLKQVTLGLAIAVSFAVYRIVLPIIIFALGTTFDVLKSTLYLDFKRLLTLKWLKTNLLNGLKLAENIGQLIPEKQIDMDKFTLENSEKSIWDRESQEDCIRRKNKIYPRD